MYGKEAIIRRMTHLLQKEIFGELSSDEKNELDAWLKSDAANREWYEEMKTLGFVERDYKFYSEITEPEYAWKRLEHDMGREQHKARWIWTFSAAAMIAVIFGVIFLLQKEEGRQQMASSSSFRPSALISLIVDRGQDSLRLEVNEYIQLEKRGLRAENNTLIYDSLSNEPEKIEYHTLTVGRGGEYRLTLSDGTVVWLNSESALRYPASFSGDKREVELWGEAFFEVTRNEEMPFHVKGGDFEIEVLGTSFNVMNYADEKVAQVTLASGKLCVCKGDQYAVIHPNQQIQMEEGRFDVRDVDARYYTSWIDNKFMFDDESLDVIVRKLARWYNLDFEFVDTTLMQTRFSGQLLKYKDITKAFELLELTTDVNFSMNQKKILIMRKKP